jgi:hypothetical protein
LHRITTASLPEAEDGGGIDERECAGKGMTHSDQHSPHPCGRFLACSMAI